MNWLLGFNTHTHSHTRTDAQPQNILQNLRDTFNVEINIFNYIVILASKENKIVVKILIKDIFLMKET